MDNYVGVCGLRSFIAANVSLIQAIIAFLLNFAFSVHRHEKTHNSCLTTTHNLVFHSAGDVSKPRQFCFCVNF